MKELLIREGSVAEVVALSNALPEFHNPHQGQEYYRRFDGVPYLILLAEVAGTNAAFKVGYERDGSFYSWMGGVLPAYRRQGIAQKLADQQEKWAKNAGYTTITFKTRNHHKGMLIFALRNGFNIIGFKAHKKVEEHRILLQKSI